LTCTEIRKQKEIEFDILHADIQGWEGEVSASDNLCSSLHVCHLVI